MSEQHLAGASPYPNPHSPSQRRLLSNLGHWIEGAVLGSSAGLALLDALRPELGWPRRWAPRLTAGAGAVLGLGILAGTLHHGGPRRYLRHEHQDRQHLRMAALIAGGGAAESAAGTGLGGVGAAGALAGVGAMFLTHEQHGTGEALRRSRSAHTRLGAGLIAAGGAKAASALGLPGPWRYAWPALALGVSAQLLTYREPPGAYE
jgi:hypothetical protein